MSDDDRLADYLRRIEGDPTPRTLVDGCACGHSLVYCRCVTYIEGQDARCCTACEH